MAQVGKGVIEIRDTYEIREWRGIADRYKGTYSRQV